MISSERAPTPLWPAKSLAARLRVDASWLVEEAIAGRIPGLSAGKVWLFDPEVVETCLLDRARRSDGATDATDIGSQP